jgi:hypothetical protein
LFYVRFSFYRELSHKNPKDTIRDAEQKLLSRVARNNLLGGLLRMVNHFGQNSP